MKEQQASNMHKLQQLSFDHPVFVFVFGSKVIFRSVLLQPNFAASLAKIYNIQYLEMTYLNI